MATVKDRESGVVHECSYRCDYKKHGSNLTAVLTKACLSDEKVAAYLKWCCVKYAHTLDQKGRSLIHMAASTGRLKLLMYLLNHKEININARDQESGYTALHRSVFYGQLHCAVRLLQAGANLQQSDLDDLSPLDHVMKDRPSILSYDANQPCEVYVWGINTSYTLGIGHNHSRTNPEPLDYFRKENISIKQAFMSKFHSLFLGNNGKIWSCGLGAGGRLGLGDEATTLVPKVIKIGSSVSDSCKAVSIGVDHSVVLLENGSVWSFGLNNYHQLGHSPPPEKLLHPKAIKTLKGLNIIGISVSKFHSVFWSDKQFYSCGLHGGQLGHLKTNENTIPTPRHVATFQLNSSTIQQVATSDGATVVVSTKGDIYLFHEYQCKKLTSKTNKMITKKICVLGGHLDHKVYSSGLQEKGGDELQILILTDKNSIYLWQKTSQQMTRCLISLHRYIDITDMVFNKSSLILTTRDGEAFQGELKIKKKKLFSEEDKPSSPKISFNKFLDKDECDYIKLKRIPHIHRAVNAACDLKGRNFAIVQTHPKAGLLEVPLVQTTEMKRNMQIFLSTISEFDTLHDVVFEVSGTRFPAHRFIVSHSSEVLEEMIGKAEVINGVPHVKIDNVQPQIFQRILSYLYTGECDLLQIGICPISFNPSIPEITNESPVKIEKINVEEISAFEFNKQQLQQQRLKKKKNEGNKPKDPIRAFKEAASIFGINSLSEALENFRYEMGYVTNAKGKTTIFSPPKFNRKHLQNLWDIGIKSENETIIKAHKCILVARSEYFNCMINQGWLESSLKTPLNLPIPGTVLDIFIRYLYTDEAPEVQASDDIDLVSHVLVLADQFLCARLKEIAEDSLGNFINLKNAAEVLQLAVTYNANQLKKCAMEFICLNLSPLLESRSLEILDDSLLIELKDFYQPWLPCMNRRKITTDSNAPDDDFVDMIYNSEPVSLDKVEEDASNAKGNLKTSRKKPQREKKNSESERTRNISVGSIISDEELYSSLDNSDGGNKVETWIKVTNHSSKAQKSTPPKSKVLPTEVSSPKAVITSPIIPRTPSIPIHKSTPIDVVQLPQRVKKDSFSEFDKDFSFLSTSSNKEFPALNGFIPERGPIVVSPKSPSDNFKKFVKLSQKQRKKLSIQSISEDDQSPTKPLETVKPVWGGMQKFESQSLTDIMKEELKGNFNSNIIASSPTWQGPSSSTCSLSAIMAAERHQRDLITRMKCKPLEYTQMEDKAMDDLMLLYDISNVTDERITVRRAEEGILISPPVWVSSHR